MGEKKRQLAELLWYLGDIYYFWRGLDKGCHGVTVLIHCFLHKCETL